MRTVGFVAFGIVLLAVLFLLAVFLRSLPDLARYRRLRKM
jgi:uncharacterized protein HemY